MSEICSAAPRPTYRAIPSQFPPLPRFDTVTLAADLQAVMELEGWTNDRLVQERINRLPKAEWVFGRPNSSIVMAAFIHVAPTGMRFNGPELGAWYAAAALNTAIFEVAHHLKREAFATGVLGISRKYRVYVASLDGEYLDIRDQQAARINVYDPTSYAASQTLGESVRATDKSGIIYDSIRHAGGTCVVVHRPLRILDVTQSDHYEISVKTASTIVKAERLKTII